VYSDQRVHEFGSLLRTFGSVDRVSACVLAARARFLVTRDDNLLALEAYQKITMVSPEVKPCSIPDDGLK
jgi:hypothetical protein